ncbi:putative E3 ubiquitin-protein ligase HECTD2 isoform 6-T6 [Syngnathus typhle]
MMALACVASVTDDVTDLVSALGNVHINRTRTCTHIFSCAYIWICRQSARVCLLLLEAPGRKAKPPLPTPGSLINTLHHRQLQLRDADMPTAPLDFKHVCELPPIGSLARPKQRATIDTLPPEVKAPFPCDPVIPLRTKTTKDFLKEMERAMLSGDWREVRDFYLTTFDSFIELNAAFKREANASFDTTEDSGLDAKFVNAVYDSLLQTAHVVIWARVQPQDIQKSVLKGIINSLLREWKGPRTKDDLRAYFILVQNPQYSSTSTYVIYAHLLRQMAALSEADHHFLVHWLKKLPGQQFRHPVECLLQFISTRLFPAEPDEVPPASKCSWWIPSATKVLALFNAANSVSSPPVMPFADFYNLTLEHIDFMEEYRTWQHYGNSSRFSFCQFPFILSAALKRAIIQKDSEQQMISRARQSLVSKVSRRQRVDMNLLFLNIRVRRAQLLADSLDELSRKRCDLKKKLRVTFVGEAGLDMGGLTKEWFLLLVRRIFHEDYGMFMYIKESRCHWFSGWKGDNNYSEFQLIGTLMGLAVYNSIALDIHFPLYCYRKLLTPPTDPCDQNALIGTATATLDDMQQIMPVSQEELGVVKLYNLKPGGDKIPVTKHNRKAASSGGSGDAGVRQSSAGHERSAESCALQRIWQERRHHQDFLGCGAVIPRGSSKEAASLCNRKRPCPCGGDGRPQLQNLQAGRPHRLAPRVAHLFQPDLLAPVSHQEGAQT